MTVSEAALMMPAITIEAHMMKTNTEDHHSTVDTLMIAKQEEVLMTKALYLDVRE